MGSFVADLAFRTTRLPGWGQTIMGSSFRLGPGGKGSNQAVAAARLGARVSFISKLGRDAFGDLARNLYRTEKIDTQFLYETEEYPTGTASIVVDEKNGENAIVVVPGACFEVTQEEVERARSLIARSSVFVTQLETRLPAVEYALSIAHDLGITTVLNPAPAQPLPERIYPLCDYLTPNETEAAMMTGIDITDLGTAERAASILLMRGARNIVITLGENGALVKNANTTDHVSDFNAGQSIETTGAGDAFNGGFVVALSEGLDLIAATRFGCAVAGISVTRQGTAAAMPTRAEVDAFLTGCPTRI